MPLRRHEATFNACLYDSATVNGLEPFIFLNTVKLIAVQILQKYYPVGEDTDW